jgi:uncharacterized membrane protein
MDWSRDRNIIFCLMLLQLAVCIPFISSFPIDLDEPFSIFYAQQDIPEMMEMFKNENNPPLHFVLLHYWTNLFGIGPVSVRSLSLLFSLLTIPVLFKFSKRILNKKFALLVLGFFIFSTFNHYHALEARVYSLLVLLVVLIINDLHLFLFVKNKAVWRLALWNTLLLYAHYLAPFIIGIEFLLLLLFYTELNIKKIWQFGLSGIISIILYVPGLLVFLERLGHFSDKGTWVPDPHITELYGNIIRFLNFNISFFILLGLVLVFAFINRGKLKSILKNELFNRDYKFVFLAFLLPYLGMYIVSVAFQPIFLDRYLLFTTPFLYLSFVIIIKLVLADFKKWYFLGLFVIPMMASCYYIPQTNREGDIMAGYIKSNISETGQILICPPFYDKTFLYHYNQTSFSNYSEKAQELKNNRIQPIYSFPDIELDEECDQVFYIDANAIFLYPDNNILQDLDKNALFVKSEVFKGDYAIYEYKILQE